MRSAGAVVLTPPDGTDLRFTSGLRLTPVFGVSLGHRRPPHDLPAIGTPEHTALLSGSIDLTEIERAATMDGLAAAWALPDAPEPPRVVSRTRPSVSSVPSAEAPAAADTLAVPRRRVGRMGPAGPMGKPLSGDPIGLGGPRLGSDESPSGTAPGRTTGRRPRLPLPTVSGPSTGALRVAEVERVLAGDESETFVSADPTPTGELVRPFVTGSVTDGLALDCVPPPVSVDVFQRSVQASLKRASDAESQADLEGSAPHPAGKNPLPTRRQLRAKQKANTSTRAVTARRLAKGGVLAVTALGVVATSPQALTALGISYDSGSLSQHAALDLAGAMAPREYVHDLTPVQVAQQQQQRRLSPLGPLGRELGDQFVDTAADAALKAGGVAARIAKDADAAADQRRRDVIARATRQAIRDPQGYAQLLVAERGWSGEQYKCLNTLWTRESSWNYQATNASSGAYGIPQALPGTRMASIAADWRTNPITQMKWGLNYIGERYTTPCNALDHSNKSGWY